MKWVRMFMSIRCKRTFRRNMVRYGSLTDAHTNRIRSTLSLFAVTTSCDLTRIVRVKIKWFLERNMNDLLNKILSLAHQIRFL
jgi:hypothetical protein